jgi:hypothetical protein
LLDAFAIAAGCGTVTEAGDAFDSTFAGGRGETAGVSPTLSKKEEFGKGAAVDWRFALARGVCVD